MTTPFQLIRCLHRPFAVYMRINRFKHHSISFVVGSCRPIYHSISFVVGSCRPIYLSISFVVCPCHFKHHTMHLVRCVVVPVPNITLSRALSHTSLSPLSLPSPCSSSPSLLSLCLSPCIALPLSISLAFSLSLDPPSLLHFLLLCLHPLFLSFSLTSLMLSHSLSLWTSPSISLSLPLSLSLSLSLPPLSLSLSCVVCACRPNTPLHLLRCCPEINFADILRLFLQLVRFTASSKTDVVYFHCVACERNEIAELH